MCACLCVCVCVCVCVCMYASVYASVNLICQLHYYRWSLTHMIAAREHGGIIAYCWHCRKCVRSDVTNTLRLYQHSITRVSWKRIRQTIILMRTESHESHTNHMHAHDTGAPLEGMISYTLYPGDSEWIIYIITVFYPQLLFTVKWHLHNTTTVFHYWSPASETSKWTIT